MTTPAPQPVPGTDVGTPAPVPPVDVTAPLAPPPAAPQTGPPAPAAVPTAAPAPAAPAPAPAAPAPVTTIDYTALAAALVAQGAVPTSEAPAPAPTELRRSRRTSSPSGRSSSTSGTIPTTALRAASASWSRPSPTRAAGPVLRSPGSTDRPARSGTSTSRPCRGSEVPGNDSFEDIRRERERHNRTVTKHEHETREAGGDESFDLPPGSEGRYPTDEELATRDTLPNPAKGKELRSSIHPSCSLAESAEASELGPGRPAPQPAADPSLGRADPSPAARLQRARRGWHGPRRALPRARWSLR